MLKTKNNVNNAAIKLFTLLFVISIITFHSDSLAGSKKKLYQEYRNAGYAEQKKGNYIDALTYFSKAVSLYEDDPKVLNDMGVIYEQIGMLSKAELHYSKAINKDPNYLPSYSNLALMYLNNGYPDKAFPYFKKRFLLAKPGDAWGEKAKEELLKIRPEFHSWVVQLEAERLNELIVKRNRDKFIETVKRANEHYEKGVKHARRQKLRIALNEFDQALKLTPDNPKIVNARKEIIKQMTNEQIKQRTDTAIRQLNAGDTRAARRELQKMLSNFPDDSLLNSK